MTASPLVQPTVGITMLVTCFVLLICSIRYLQHALDLDGEVARKLFHSIGAVTALALPWLFASEWPVIVVTTLIFIALSVIRGVHGLRESVGRVMHTVDRRSIGDICWPIGVGITFVAADGRPVSFCAAILVFAFADPAAALVGTRHGSHRYKAAGGYKSVEGSAAFFIITFMIVAAAALIANPVGIAEASAIATTIATLLTLIEASVCRGLDNALVPTLGVVAFNTVIAAPGPAMLAVAGSSALLLALLIARSVHLRVAAPATVGGSL